MLQTGVLCLLAHMAENILGECGNSSSATQSLASPVDGGFLIKMIRESQGILWISFLKDVTVDQLNLAQGTVSESQVTTVTIALYSSTHNSFICIF